MLKRFCKLKNEKIPFETNWQNTGYTREDLKNWYGPIGLIIPDGYVVVDIDNREDANKVKTIAKGGAMHLTPHGLHLIYKLPKVLKIQNWVKKSVMLGIDVDFRVSGGQIVYPTTQTNRKIIVEFTGNEIELPEIFWPCAYPLPKNYIQLQEGERDSEITAHYGRLLGYACDAKQIIHTINCLLDNPLEADQVDKIINSIDKREAAKETPSDKKSWYTKGGKFVAHKLAEYLAEEGNVIYYNGLWYLYANGVWSLCGKEYIGQYIRRHLNNPRMSQINETEEQLKILRVNDNKRFNVDKELITFKNTAYKRGEALCFSKEHYSTMRINADYDPAAPTPENWLKFVNTSLGDDINRRALQEMMGYFLVTNLAAKSFFILHGPTDCGKSVISSVLSSLIGHEKISNVSLQAICDPSNRWAEGELYNKLLNINTDISDRVLKDTSVLKQFTGVVGDEFLRYEFKCVQPFSGPVTCRLMFICNSLPPTTDHSSAFFNRVKIISFPKSIPVENQDRKLIDKLRLEAPGIINWCLEGLERLIENKYRFTEDKKVKDDYIEYSNTVLQFVKEHCEFDVTHSESSSELYKLYVFYCKENGYIPFNHRNFTKELVNTGKCQKAKTSKQRLIKGLKITYRPEVVYN